MIVIRTMRHSDIKYGILGLSKGDGTKQFFQELPERYDIIINGKDLHDRKTLLNKIWLGREAMKTLNPDDVVRISKNGKIVTKEKQPY